MWRCGWRSGLWRQLRRLPGSHPWRHPLRQLSLPARGTQLPYMEVLPEVAEAVAAGRPVVALETAMVTHGMRHPENLNTVKEAEEIIRSNGAVPASIGILEGKVHIGLSSVELSQMSQSMSSALKVSRRDIAYTISQGLSGGTTVAATMLCAHKAGIPVFVTGGLGGVHRDGENTLDISADLMELGRTPVAVVCAGVKSILDIQRTLEVLETQGVAVATYGNSTEFPAFFTPSSGFKAPYNVQSPAETAKLINASLQFGMGSGLVITVPIPAQGTEEERDITQAIDQAVSEAKSEGVGGKELTPYLLRQVDKITAGKSLQANIDLIKNNAKIGSLIAVELAEIRSGHKTSPTKNSYVAPSASPANQRGGQNERNQSLVWEKPVKTASARMHAHTHKKPVVVGGSVLDFIAKITSPDIRDEGTNPGSLHQTFGGVGRNMAECLARMGTFPFFISALGTDSSGWSIAGHLQECGMSLLGVHQSSSLPTASYCVVLNSKGEMFCGIGDMDIHATITVDWVQRFISKLKTASIVCLDGNIPSETMQFVCEECSKDGIPVWFEPTCVQRAQKPVLMGVLSKISYTSPNLAELRSMHRVLYGTETSTEHTGDLSLEQKLMECTQLVPGLLESVPHVFVTLGGDGVVWGKREAPLLHFSTVGRPTHMPVVNVTGAGDSFAGGVISCLTRGINFEVAIKAGMRAASLSVGSQHAISPEVTSDLFSEKSVLEWAPWTPTEL